ncbi:MAG: hypothetical protein ACSLFP_17215 [Acidimicrobiales bacterium]
MSVTPLSQEWLDLRVEHLSSLPAVDGASARLLHVVSGAPDGEVRFGETYVDGRLTEASLAPAADADLELTYKHDVALLIATGDLHLVDGFMQGRVKLVGPTGRLMDLLPALESPEHAAAEATVAAQT